MWVVCMSTTSYSIIKNVYCLGFQVIVTRLSNTAVLLEWTDCAPEGNTVQYYVEEDGIESSKSVS